MNSHTREITGDYAKDSFVAMDDTDDLAWVKRIVIKLAKIDVLDEQSRDNLIESLESQ